MSIAKPFQKTALVAALMTASGAYAAIEEVIVTAEKREASLQDTPIAINALTSDMIEQKGISSVSDLFEKVPGVVGYEGPSSRGSISLNIRGIGSGNPNSPSTDPANALYVDGVYLGSGAGNGVDAMDLERVEVLKGPQGTLYGRNSTGGAVNFITKKPGQEAAAKIKAGIGSKGHESLSMRFDVPVSDTLGVAVSAYSRQRDELYGNTNSDVSGFENIDRQGYRFAARFEPTETLSIDYAFNHDEVDEHTQMMGVVGFNPRAGSLEAGVPNYNVPINSRDQANTVAQTAGGVQYGMGFPSAVGLSSAIPNNAQVQSYLGWASDFGTWTDEQLASLDEKPSAGSSDTDSQAINEVDAHSLTLTWDLSDDLQFKSLTGFRENYSLSSADLDGMDNTQVLGHLPILTIGGLLLNTVTDYLSETQERELALGMIDALNERGSAPVYNNYATTEHEQFSQEFQLVGSSEQLDYAVGLYYYSSDTEFRNHRIASFPLATSDTSSYDLAAEATSIFGQATWRPEGSKVALTAGLRYTEETKEVTYLWQGFNSDFVTRAFDYMAQNMTASLADYDVGDNYVTNAEAGSLPERANYGNHFEQDFDNLSGKITAQYFVSDDMNVYATYSTGYRSGGFNGDFYDFDEDAADAFDEETITSMELGLKASFWDGKAQLNAALFSYSYDDLQVSTVRTVGNSVTSSIGNAGKADREGLEIGLLMQPTDSLLLSLDYTGMSGDFDEYPSVTSAMDVTLVMADEAKRGLSPDNQVIVGADWTITETSQGVLALNTTLSWQDETQSVASATAVYDTDTPADRVRDTPVSYDYYANESRTLLNARLSWSMPMESSNLVVSLWGNNITDEEYGVFGFNYGDALALNLHQYGAPRTVGLDISWEM